MRVPAPGASTVPTADGRASRSPSARLGLLALAVTAALTAGALVGPAGAAETSGTSGAAATLGASGTSVAAATLGAAGASEIAGVTQVAPIVATSATIRPSFSPDRLGAKAAFTFAVHFTGGEAGVPSPVRRAVVQLPPGLTLDIPKLRFCTRARLQARGASGCPAQSEIGRGRALGDVRAGVEVESEEAYISAYVGPPQGTDPTIEILGQGYSPLDERVVITATALPDNPPYGEKLVMAVPAIPSIPLEPNASTVSFSLTVGGAAFRKQDPNTALLPSSCPAGGFPFDAEFTYEDGSTSNSTATVPCP